MAGIQN